MVLAVILSICFLALIAVVPLSLAGKKGTVNTDVKKKLDQAIKDKGFNTIIETGPKVKPVYNPQLDQIGMKEGKTLGHVAEAFHEFGHAIDAYKKNLLEKEYDAWWATPLFLILKYSLPAAIFVHAVVVGGMLDNIWLTLLTYALIIFSLVFTTVTLFEEIRATKYGLKEIKVYFELSKREMRLIFYKMMSGMISYITLFLLAYITLGFQVYANWDLFIELLAKIL